MPRPRARPDAGHHTAATASEGRVRTENQPRAKMPISVAATSTMCREGRHDMGRADGPCGRAGALDRRFSRRSAGTEVIAVTFWVPRGLSPGKWGWLLVRRGPCPPAGPQPSGVVRSVEASAAHQDAWAAHGTSPRWRLPHVPPRRRERVRTQPAAPDSHSGGPWSRSRGRKIRVTHPGRRPSATRGCRRSPRWRSVVQ
jgi:hypothetical protein